MFECHRGQLLSVTMEITTYRIWDDWRPRRPVGALDTGEFAICLSNECISANIRTCIRVLCRHGLVFVHVAGESPWFLT